ncbi:hypothetical protein QAD02_016768 [Eretmocerus hayati]|uniref:Uncharacterized protein n=1 Tax=Eretmocerus hayati TaxID=131215 RepID=A0ACC2PDU6_9HYME|nr:hypothetical protein QAD02_016768 [Eretmocerus hayati]
MKSLLIFMTYCLRNNHGANIVRWGAGPNHSRSLTQENAFESSKSWDETAYDPTIQRKFDGERFDLIFYEVANLWKIQASHTVTGFGGDLWTALAQFMDFRIVPSYVTLAVVTQLEDPSNLKNIMEKMKINKLIITLHVVYVRNKSNAFEFTHTLFEDGSRFFMRPDYHLEETWMLNIFSKTIWFLIILSYLLVWGLSYLSLHLTPKRMRSIRLPLFFHNFFSTYTIFCNQAESDLIPPFTTLQDLLDSSDYNLLLVNKSIDQEEIKADSSISSHLLESNRVKYFQDFKSMWMQACSEGEQNVAMQRKSIQIDPKLPCKLEPQRGSFYRTQVVAALSKSSQMKKSINYGYDLQLGLENLVYFYSRAFSFRLNHCDYVRRFSEGFSTALT